MVKQSDDPPYTNNRQYGSDSNPYQTAGEGNPQDYGNCNIKKVEAVFCKSHIFMDTVRNSLYNSITAAAVPVGSGLLRGPSCAVPSCCGVILYYFMNTVSERSTVLQGKETESVQKLQILLDALINNQEMWLNILAFVVVLMVVYLISRTSADYSWRIGVAAGAVVYILIMILGGMFLSVNINIGGVILSGVLAAVVGLIIEFAALGVDYSRSETTQFEDDEYVYYVKAVPKSFVAQAEKKIKNISSESVEKPDEEEEAAPVERVEETTFDFEKQLEESLKDL